MSKLYGATPVATEDMTPWNKHEHPWNSEGRVAEVMNETIHKLDALIAEETKAAVADYAEAAQVTLGVSPRGELLVGVQLYNNSAAIHARVPFLILVRNALQQIKPVIGVDEGAQALFSALIKAGVELAKLGQGAPVTQNAIPQRQAGHQQHAVRSVSQRPVRAPINAG